MILHEFQEKILKECLTKKSGAISVPMGSGKTLISLSLANTYTKNGKHLVVVSKSLLHSWSTEIEKWFPSIKYKILDLKDDFENDIENDIENANKNNLCLLWFQKVQTCRNTLAVRIGK